MGDGMKENKYYLQINFTIQNLNKTNVLSQLTQFAELRE